MQERAQKILLLSAAAVRSRICTSGKSQEEIAERCLCSGSVKYFSQKSLRCLARAKSASNGGVLQGDLQVLHVHVLLVAPLSTSYMTQSGTD